VLPFDLRESAMLGDGGANLLGFAAGIALYGALPDPWVAVAAGGAVVPERRGRRPCRSAA
jgi:hypothetical protein